MMKGFLAAAAIALLSVAAQPRSENAAPDRSTDPQLTTAPSLPPSISAQSGILRPGAPESATAAANTGWAPLADVGTPAAAGRPSFLIEARLREKYRPFLESLTSP